jgi:hypothetical protein
MRLGSVAALLLRLCCAPRAAAFNRALSNPRDAQRKTLSRILALCACTQYGRALGLDPGLSIEEFRALTPVVDYAALQPWIERQRAGGAPVLSPGPVRNYEPTSGSSGAVKHIPYNDGLLGSFRALFAIWAHDLLAHAVRPRSARMFISVSSPVRADGFSDDSEYLGKPLRVLLGRFLVIPPRFAATQSAEAWRDAVACALAACADLEVISVWNPSYLLILLEHLEEHRERLLPALAPARRTVFERGRLRWEEVWPALQLISCWADVAAAAPASRLAALFPGARLQGKGLVATEAPLTVPLIAARGCVPLVDEIFLELEDSSGRLRLLHEAQTGGEYAIVLSQAGGLLRYRLGDRVSVKGWHLETPLLAFTGRADDVADLVGEKLNEAFVAKILGELAEPGAFCTVLPVLPERGRPHYWLLTDDPRPELASDLEAALVQALRYREARLLGQLGAVQATKRPDMRRAVHDALAASGIKAGDVKDRALIPSLDLARRVRAHLNPGQSTPA